MLQVTGRALGIRRVGVTHITHIVLHCGAICGGGVWEGTMLLALLSAGFSVTSLTTHKQIGPFWCRSLGGWACVRSRTLWVFPANSPARLGVSAAASDPTDVFSQRFWGFISPLWSPGLCCLSRSPVVLPVYLHVNVGLPSLPASASPRLPSAALPWVLFTWLPISASPTSLDECFSLTPWLSDFHTVRFSGNSGCFLIFKFFVVLLLVVQRGTVYPPKPPSWPDISFIMSIYPLIHCIFLMHLKIICRPLWVLKHEFY